MQFLEFDTSIEFIVINQDDTYSSASLFNGDVVTFQSISNKLKPEVPLQEQLEYVPGGVQLTVRGKTQTSKRDYEMGGDVKEETIISNRITWSFTNSCGENALPVENGDNVGWVTIVSRSFRLFGALLHGQYVLFGGATGCYPKYIFYAEIFVSFQTLTTIYVSI